MRHCVPLTSTYGGTSAYICDSNSTLGVGTGTLDELAGSQTRLAIYPTLTICYQRVVIHALLDPRFKGRR